MKSFKENIQFPTKKWLGYYELMWHRSRSTALKIIRSKVAN